MRATRPITAASVKARPPAMPVYGTPGGHVVRTLGNPGLLGAPLTFLQLERRPGWLR